MPITKDDVPGDAKPATPAPKPQTQPHQPTPDLPKNPDKKEGS